MDIWVAGIYDARESQRPAMGAWICPTLRTYAVTKRAYANSPNDGIRIGCAMAILSATYRIGGELVVHVSSYPALRWVGNPKRVAPLPNLMYRLLYKMEVHPLIESGKIQIVKDDESYHLMQLYGLLTRGEVPRSVPC